MLREFSFEKFCERLRQGLKELVANPVAWRNESGCELPITGDCRILAGQPIAGAYRHGNRRARSVFAATLCDRPLSSAGRRSHSVKGCILRFARPISPSKCALRESAARGGLPSRGDRLRCRTAASIPTKLIGEYDRHASQSCRSLFAPGAPLQTLLFASTSGNQSAAMVPCPKRERILHRRFNSPYSVSLNTRPRRNHVLPRVDASSVPCPHRQRCVRFQHHHGRRDNTKRISSPEQYFDRAECSATNVQPTSGDPTPEDVIFCISDDHVDALYLTGNGSQ